MSQPSKSSFFRQSSWMVIATFAGGACMALVHTVASKMGPQYSTFVSLLRLLIIMSAPAAALQTIFARQAAMVTSDVLSQQLHATSRAVVMWTTALWAVLCLVVLAAFKPISNLLSVSNPAALYFTLILCLTSLWVPIGKGLLQGRHEFGGLGWLQITDGVGRFGVVILMIHFLHAKAAGGMFAAVVGQVVTVLLAAWLTRDLWLTRPKTHFLWRTWFGEAIPVTLGLGTVFVMSSIDMIFVQGLFPDKSQTALYGAAMLTGFAIIQFIAPVALVMFARVAQSVARAERADSLGMTLIATAAFGVTAALGCTILPQLPLRGMFISNRAMWAATPLVPWFAWALLPLTVANVLVQNILARGRYRAVPWLVLVPFVYAAALCFQAHTLLAMKPFDAFTRVIQTLGCASLLLCAVSAWFSRAIPGASIAGPDSAEAHGVFHKPNSPKA
jgi:O-antigen/teichoic acid export membrane protein